MIGQTQKPEFWAKTTRDGRPGISVYDHCINVGCVAEAIIGMLPVAVRQLLPEGVGTLAALHDVGKITLGFQAKCPEWLLRDNLPEIPLGDLMLSVTDHALVSQVFLQSQIDNSKLRLWTVAVGAHHGRPKGKNARFPSSAPEVLSNWSNEHRLRAFQALQSVFGPIPTKPPAPQFAPHYSDLWLVAGLISVADWIGSNESWFPPDRGLSVAEAKKQAMKALREIGWPGGGLRRSSFSMAFGDKFKPNPLQQAVAEATRTPGIIIVEGPMGCGKTEAALFAAQQLIAAGSQRGIYFALPTQVTSNRIYQRVERFLRNTLTDAASFRLAHGNSWLEDDFDLLLNPSFRHWKESDGESPIQNVHEIRSWFASAKQALLAPYGVGTIDQALLAVVAVKHFFVRRFALAGKVVILDEVHSYDIYTGTLITSLIRELMNLRCSVIVLSATLTHERRRELLLAAGIDEREVPDSYPLITTGHADKSYSHVTVEWSHRLRVVLRTAVIPDEETIDELIARAEVGQHVLWIRNTVVEAQEAYRFVSSNICQGAVKIGLLHSRFPFHRRAELEADWLDRLGPERHLGGPGSILIATQVVEQSVDIDLDFIVSDLAPTDMLLQRIGRLWRHERQKRKADTAEFWIRFPAVSTSADVVELKKAIGRSARVYAPYVLLRSMSVWSKYSELSIPSDIRPLLEATYAESGADESPAWKELHEELEKEKASLSANAEAATRVLAEPLLADRDDVLTRRKGPPTTPLLLLRSAITGRNGMVAVSALDHSVVEISEHEWRRASARFLHQWIVRVPRWMIPKELARPHWLSLHGPDGVTHATLCDNGRCSFDAESSSLMYDPHLGIYADKPPQSVQQSWKDDDDEFDC